MSYFDDELWMTLPGYIIKHHVRPGNDPRHLVEHVLARLWSIEGCRHPFELVWSVDDAQFVAAWVSAPGSYWKSFLEEAFGTEAEAAQEMIAGLEAMLAEQPEGDDRG